VIRSLNGIKKQLGTRRAICFLRNRFQQRINPDGSWDAAVNTFLSYSQGESSRQAEREAASDFNTVAAYGDLDQYTHCRRR
jgi:hypothetical protein